MIPRASKHSVIATAVGGEAFEVAVRGHTVRTDQPAMGDTAPTPLEMVSVALAGCVALYAQRYCSGAGIAASGLAVEVNPIWRADEGRIGRYDVLLHLPSTIPVEHHEAIRGAASSCPVHHTLAHGSDIDVRMASRPLETDGDLAGVPHRPATVQAT